MNKWLVRIILSLFFVSGMSFSSSANINDVFVPIAKYMKLGSAEKLSVWFADNLEIEILSKSNDCSKKQALQILKTFFKNYTPRSFKIDYKTSNNNMKYAEGTLKAGGDTFRVMFLMHFADDEYNIHHLKIELKK